MPKKSGKIVRYEEVNRLFDYDGEKGIVYWKDIPEISQKKRSKPITNIDNCGQLRCFHKGEYYLARYIVWSLCKKVDIDVDNFKLKSLDKNLLNLKIENLAPVIYEDYSIIRLIDDLLTWWDGEKWNSDRETRLITNARWNAEQLRMQLRSYKFGKFFLVKEV